MAVARTLPQQVQKNKDDIKNLENNQSTLITDIANINQAIDQVETDLQEKQDKAPNDNVNYVLKNGQLHAIGNVIVWKGSVPTYADLLAITGMSIGDMYDVVETGNNYAWTGTVWDNMGPTVNLSNYYTKSQIESFLADKLNRIYGATTYPQVYFKEANGTQGMRDFSALATPNSIAQRNALGQLIGVDATAANQLATKGQMDAIVGNIEDALDAILGV